MKKILIIKGHPREESFCNALVERYIEGAKAVGIETRTLDLQELALESWLKYDWSRNHDSLPQSPDLAHSKELVTWSDHIVFAYPTYWGRAARFSQTILRNGNHRPLCVQIQETLS